MGLFVIGLFIFVWWKAGQKGRNPWKWLFMSIFFTPLLTGVALLFVDDLNKPKEEPKPKRKSYLETRQALLAQHKTMDEESRQQNICPITECPNCGSHSFLDKGRYMECEYCSSKFVLDTSRTGTNK